MEYQRSTYTYITVFVISFISKKVHEHARRKHIPYIYNSVSVVSFIVKMCTSTQDGKSLLNCNQNKERRWYIRVPQLWK